MYQQQVLKEKSAHHCSLMTKIVFVPPDVEADQRKLRCLKHHCWCRRSRASVDCR